MVYFDPDAQCLRDDVEKPLMAAMRIDPKTLSTQDLISLFSRLDAQLSSMAQNNSLYGRTQRYYREVEAELEHRRHV